MQNNIKYYKLFYLLHCSLLEKRHVTFRFRLFYFYLIKISLLKYIKFAIISFDFPQVKELAQESRWLEQKSSYIW